jgi:hypothetical protein
MRLSGCLEDLLELGVESLLVYVVGIRVFHPVDGEEISKARVDVLSLD